jgi:hypothetical protein
MLLFILAHLCGVLTGSAARVRTGGPTVFLRSGPPVLAGDADGNGIVSEQRLYQLVRQVGTIADRTFEVRLLDPGVRAYAFTFG